ncbi:MAG: phosphopantetheine-binding protein [Bacteroidales bacterium]|nr:phosphopantetheine-binding protein [Bacteroidales bacterium]
MTIEEIQEKARKVLAEEFEVEEQVITPDASIRETLNLDSLDMVDIVVLADKYFNVKITAKELEVMNTFNDFYLMLLQRQNQRQ